MNNPPDSVTEQVAADRAAHGNSPPKKLWTPGMKLPERVKELAAVFFVEAWKAALDAAPIGPDSRAKDLAEFRANAAAFYQDCVAMARVCVEIDNTEVPRY